MSKDRKIESLLGKTLTAIDKVEECNETRELIFTCTDGVKFRMYHWQDCCEDVYLNDITGNLDDLLYSPIVMAESVSNEDPEAFESATWTFIKLATRNGYVTLRWYGSSNGYYSESVDFEIIE
jgi:hypothetical protein